nr:MAG TPA: hypothetical protein [Caudoviricetes sp.]
MLTAQKKDIASAVYIIKQTNNFQKSIDIIIKEC